MTITDSHFDNEKNAAIEFAIRHRNLLICNEREFPQNCVLREINRTDPTDIIFDIFSENRKVIGIVCITDGRYTNGGRYMCINTVYFVQCSLNNYNNHFIFVGVNTLEEIFDLIRFMKEIVDYAPNNVYYLDYVYIPDNLLNKWYIPPDLNIVNRNRALAN